jgi:hypothetical protein
MSRLDILMDVATLLQLAKRGRYADCKAQELSHFHGSAEEPVQRFASRIFKKQNGPPVFAHNLQRLRSRPTVQFILQPYS